MVVHVSKRHKMSMAACERVQVFREYRRSVFEISTYIGVHDLRFLSLVGRVPAGG